jgi:menaquinone-dependent protoporphyrinogen oxidase
MRSVLVAYATDHGSTLGVAERIADRLRQYGLTVHLRAMAEVPDVTRYRAAVLGSAVHGGKWLPEAKRFIDANTVALGELLVWLFSVSTLGDEESMFSPRVAKRLRSMRKQPPETANLRMAVAVQEHRNFAGAIARSQWPTTGRAFFRAMGGHYGDHRNWPAIDAWTDSIARAVSRAGTTDNAGPPGSEQTGTG